MMQPPRVALFADSFHEVNGVSLTCREFERFAGRRGLPFFSCHAGPETRSWRTGTVTRFEFRRSGLGLQIESDLRFDLLFLRHLEPLIEELARFQPDVVHVTGPSDCGLLGILAAHRLDVPVAASWHTNVHEYGARRFRGKAAWLPTKFADCIAGAIERASLDLTLLFYRMASVCYAPNPEVARMLDARLGKPVEAMPRGIDTVLFSPRNGRRGCGPFRIGYVGRLSREKGVESLVEIERALVAAGEDDFEFVIVGDGGQRAWLERRLKRARFTGVLRGGQLAGEYAAMDLFLFPSKTDTYGNVVMEALASGIPALVTGQGGPKFLVRHGRTGWVYSSPQEAARLIAGLSRRPALLEAMSRRARRQALRSNGWDAVFDRVYAGYSGIPRLAAAGRAACERPVQA